MCYDPKEFDKDQPEKWTTDEIKQWNDSCKKKEVVKQELDKISPEYLLTHGFVNLNDVSEEDGTGVGIWDLNVSGEEDGEMIFIEKKLHRKQFAVVLNERQYTNGVKYYTFEIFVRINIGCGFANIPNQFTEMTQKHFAMLYEAITRDPLKPIQ